MRLFETMFAYRIPRDPAKRPKKSAKATLSAIFDPSVPRGRGSGCLDLSPFTVPAEQMYRLTVEMEVETV